MKKQITCFGMLLVVLGALLLFLTGCPLGSPHIDKTPPTGTVVINNGDTYSIDTSVTLTLRATDDSGSSGIRMMISNFTDFAGANWETFASTSAWMLTAGDGPKTVSVKFKDAAGNESTVCSDSILLDSALPGPPGTPYLAAADDTGVSNSDNITRQTTGLTFSGTGGVSGATMRLYDAVRGLLGSAVAGGAGDWSLDVDLAEGSYVLFVRTVDSLGVESPSSPSLAVTVDTTPPGVPSILKPGVGENTGANKRPLFSWTSIAGTETYELQADRSSGFDSIDYDWTNLSGTSYTPASDMSASGTVPVGTRYYMRMRALDAAGNTGAWSNAGALRYVNVGRFDNDFNGDGYADAIVGALGYNNYQGRTYIYYGGATMNNVADVTMTGEAAGDKFGVSVASAGDVNGDGYADAIVGASGYSSGQGRAYIYYGGSSMDSSADLTMSGEAAGDGFGESVSSAGDVDGDGYADAVVGALSSSSGQGRAYMYHGGSSMDNVADLTMSGGAAGDNFGASVASAGDVNGDGYADAIVGAPLCNGQQGRAYIYFGGSLMDNSADVIMTGGSSGDNFGASVAPAGDVNGDGYADAIVGAYGYNTHQGRAYIYYGAAAMDNSADVIMTGEKAGNVVYSGDAFGHSVASAGDVNGDGYADVIVGAHVCNSFQGRAYIYYGGSSMDNGADVTMSGEAGWSCFGLSVASAGDVNGDGYADAIVGAYYYNSVQGRAYIYYGGSSMNSGADVVMTGEGSGNYFGWVVALAGDPNDSVHPDATAGAPCCNSGYGLAFVCSRGSSMDNNADVTMSGGESRRV
jgi:hypothetical protein